MGWYEDMQEEQRKERVAALRRAYDRAKQDNEFVDCEESWRAFVAGWYGELKFERAKYEYRTAGPMAWSLMAWLVGGLLLGIIVLSYSVAPNALILHRVYIGGGIGVGLIVLGFLSLRRERRLATEARAKHLAKWGDTVVDD